MATITIASLLLGLALLVLLILFLIRPFFKPQAVVEADQGPQEALMAHKEALLEAIRGLDFDHETGKLPDQEYELQRAALMSQTAETLKALDELPAIPLDDDVYAQIDAAVSALRGRRTVTEGAQAYYCANCGHALDGSDRFCARCGQPIYQIQPST
ncbi:MAG: zinc-ribbon domain-containing protein [Candidatus Promineifilaceae bacterium]